jgi:hypothetical protein
MKGNEQVIAVLNQVLRKELTGINQYFIHAKMCENWGYGKLKKVLWDESIGEMKHADRIIERLLFLEATPNMSTYDKIMVGSGIKQSWKTISVWNSRRSAFYAPASRLAWKRLMTRRGNCSSIFSWTKKSMWIGSRPSCTRSTKSATKTI